MAARPRKHAPVIWKIAPNSTHLAGEYFVAAELYRRGYSVGMTIGNAKAIDLFAEKGVKTASIQVKAIAKRQSGGWPVMRNKVIGNVVYIFVCLNPPGTPPAFFVATSGETRRKVRQYATRGIVALTSLRNDRYIDRWDKVKEALR